MGIFVGSVRTLLVCTALASFAQQLPEPQLPPSAPSDLHFEPTEGKLLAAVERGGAISVWNIADPARYHRVCTIFTNATNVASSNTQKLLYSAGRDGVVRSWRWDCQTGAPFGTIKLADVPLTAISISPTDRNILVGTAGGEVFIVDSASKGVQKVRLPDPPLFFPPAELPSSLGVNNFGFVGFVDYRFNKARNEPAGREPIFSLVSSVQMAADGTVFAGTFLGRIYRCRADADPPCRLFADHPWGVRHSQIAGDGALVKIHPNGSVIATAGHDTTIRLWTSEGLPIGELKRPDVLCAAVPQPTTSIAFSPSGLTLVTASHDHCLIFWDVASRRPRKVSFPDPPSGRAFVFHPSGNFAAAIDNGVELWDLDYAPQSHSQGAGPMSMPGVAHAPDGRTLALASDTELAVYKEDGTLHCRTAHGTVSEKPSINQVAFLGSAPVVLLGGGDLLSFTSECRLRRRIKLNQPLASRFKSLSSSSDRVLIASGKTIVSWDGQSSLPETVLTHTDLVTSLAAHPSGLLFADEKGRVLAASRDGRITASRQAHSEPVFHLATTLTGSDFASATFTGEMQFWDGPGRPRGKPLRGPQQYLTGLAISADRERVLSINADEGIFLWGKSGNLQRKLGPGRLTLHAEFSPHADQFLEVRIDGTMRWWFPPGQRRGQRLGGGESVRSVRHMAISGNGARIATVYGNQTLQVWDEAAGKWTPPAELRFAPHHVAVEGSVIALTSQDKILALTFGAGLAVLDPAGRPVRIAISPKDNTLWALADRRKLNLTTQRDPSQPIAPPEPSEDWVLVSGPVPKTAMPDVVTPMREVQGLPSGISAFSVSGGGVAVGTNRGRLYWVQNGATENLGEASVLPIRQIAIRPEGDDIAAIDDAGTLYLWSRTRQQEVLAVQTGISGPTHLSFAARGDLLAVGGVRQASHIVELRTTSDLALYRSSTFGQPVAVVHDARDSLFIGLPNRVLVLDYSGRQKGQVAFLGPDRAVTITSADGRFRMTHAGIEDLIGVSDASGARLSSDTLLRYYDPNLDIFESKFRYLWRKLWMQHIFPARDLFRSQHDLLQVGETALAMWLLALWLAPGWLARRAMAHVDGSPSFVDLVSRFKFLEGPLEWLCSNQRCRRAYLSDSRKSVVGRLPAPSDPYVDLGHEADLESVVTAVVGNQPVHLWLFAPGGRGKTTLAIRIIQQLSGNSSAAIPVMIDQDWLLGTNPAGINSFLNEIAKALSDGARVPSNSMVRQWLHEGAVAIIIDGASEKAVRNHPSFFRDVVDGLSVRHLIVTARTPAPTGLGFRTITPNPISRERFPVFCEGYLDANVDAVAQGIGLLQQFSERNDLSPLFARLILRNLASGDPAPRSSAFLVHSYVQQLSGGGMRVTDYYWAAQIAAATIMDWSVYAPLTVRRELVVGAISASANHTYFRSDNDLEISATNVVQELITSGLLSANAADQVRFREDTIAEYLAASWLSLQAPDLVRLRLSTLRGRDEDRAHYLSRLMSEVRSAGAAGAG